MPDKLRLVRALRRIVLPLCLLGLLVPASAQGASGYCSPTGDYCYSAKKRNGAVRLVLGTFSFRGRVEVCVAAPDGSRDCESFRLRKRRGIFEIDVRWSAHFPRKGAGTYRVSFAPEVTGAPLQRGVTFRLKR